MGVLRTIVATAVIVFALTTVAMAGVQHFTKSGQATVQTAQQPNYTVTLTDKQLAKLLLAGQKQATTRTTKHAQQRHTQKHDQNVHHTYTAAHTATNGTSHQSPGSAASRTGYRCNSDSHNDCWGRSGGSSGSHSGGGCCW